MKKFVRFIQISTLSLCLITATFANSTSEIEKYLKTDIALDIENKTNILLIISNGHPRKDHGLIKQTTAENYINSVYCPDGGCYMLRPGDTKTFSINMPEDNETHEGYFTIDSEYNEEKDEYNFSSMFFFSQNKKLTNDLYAYTTLSETNRSYSGEENNFLVLTGRYDHAPGNTNLAQHFKIEITPKKLS